MASLYNTLIGQYFPSYKIGTLNAAARDGNNFIVGTGIPADHVTLANKTAILPNGVNLQKVGLEIGVYGHDRQGPAVPVTFDDDNDAFRFDFDIGTQIGNPARQENQLTWSFYSNAGLDKLEMRILVDGDPGIGETDYDTFHYKPDKINGGADLYNNRKFLGSPIVTDDEGNQNVTQQSSNLAFAMWDGIEKWNIDNIGLTVQEKIQYDLAVWKVSAFGANFLTQSAQNYIANIQDRIDDANAADPFNFATDGGEFDVKFQFVNKLTGAVELENHVILDVDAESYFAAHPEYLDHLI